ncbi:GNAT family N-acetyltransferase [Amycolatopsis sp. NPDC059027]|uniref:GNAT family N-acetyltransferase n=1 Tax=unclassified Amycolatopsis TaxID=2618356 RepID=UPI0036701791
MSDAGGVRVALRQTTVADAEYCFRLHEDTLGPYVDRIWGWDEAEQRARFAFSAARTQIITADGIDAGSLIVETRPEEIYLGRIEIHPDYQSRGIGGHVVRTLVAQATERGLPVVLDVLAVNVRAKAFYERLGFVEIGRPAEHKIRLRHG